jgi:hypothetical protein
LNDIIYTIDNKIKLTSTDMTTKVKSVVELFENKAKEKGIEITLRK